MDDPFLTLLARMLRLKYEIAAHGPTVAYRSFAIPSARLPRTPRGELIALGALIAASAARPTDALSLAETALTTTNSGEAYFYASSAQVIASLRADPERRETVSAARRFVDEALEAQFVDTVVVSIRSYPALLKCCLHDSGATSSILEVLTRSGDLEIARMAGLDLGPVAATPTARAGLTPREAELLALLAQGLSNRAIAGQLFLTEATVKTHVRHVFRKLGVNTRVQAVLKAHELNLIET
jgi:ATP/maltotriose-dependent transcriptional regulator MalT